jgi:hypothetical protein
MQRNLLSRSSTIAVASEEHVSGRVARPVAINISELPRCTRNWLRVRRFAFLYTSGIGVCAIGFGTLLVWLIAPDMFNPNEPMASSAFVAAIVCWYVLMAVFLVCTISAISNFTGYVITGQLKPRYLANIYIALILSWSMVSVAMFMHDTSRCGKACACKCFALIHRGGVSRV